MKKRPPPPTAVALIACVLMAAGLARQVWNRHTLPRPSYPLIDDRYRALRAALPGDRDLRYLSDDPTGTSRVQAAYALGPHLLVDEKVAARFGIADLSDGARLAGLCAAAGMRPIAVFEGGKVALLERVR